MPLSCDVSSVSSAGPRLVLVTLSGELSADDDASPMDEDELSQMSDVSRSNRPAGQGGAGESIRGT